MPMNLHLFSTPGERDIQYIVDASKPYLVGKDEPLAAYLPMASLDENWLEFTTRSFKGLAQVAALNTETMTFSEMESIVRRAHVIYIPGGNTYLLAHRLHVSRWLPYLQKKIRSGLPLVAFSAGSVLCGPNIITSRDMNMIETNTFSGLHLLPFNIHVHYEDSAERDDWLGDFHVFQSNPILLLSDGAYLHVENKKVVLVRGEAWILRRGSEKEKIELKQDILL